MDAQKREEFRDLLRERLREIGDTTVDTRDGMGHDRGQFADPLDRATLESNRNFTLRLRDRERKLVKKLNEALERIELGTYGDCEECGEPIDEKRLRSRPVTTLCIDCKEEQELLEEMEL
jgi:DnaK suppressor protein